MGFSINFTGKRILQHKGKTKAILEDCNGKELSVEPPSFDEVPEGKALIAIIDNGAFEEAWFVFDQDEFEHFKSDESQKKYLLIERKLAERLSGFEESTSK